MPRKNNGSRDGALGPLVEWKARVGPGYGGSVRLPHPGEPFALEQAFRTGLAEGIRIARLEVERSKAPQKRARANPLRAQIEADLDAGLSVSRVVAKYGASRAPHDTVRGWYREMKRKRVALSAKVHDAFSRLPRG